MSHNLTCTDGKTIENLLLTWQAENPVQVAKHVVLPLFKLSNYSTTYCNSQTETGFIKNHKYVPQVSGQSTDITFSPFQESTAV